MIRGEAANLYDASAQGGTAALRSVPELADAMRGIDRASAAAPRSPVSAAMARSAVPTDGAGAWCDNAGAMFDGVMVTNYPCTLCDRAQSVVVVVMRARMLMF